jgi:hypothetical protein
MDGPIPEPGPDVFHQKETKTECKQVKRNKNVRNNTISHENSTRKGKINIMKQQFAYK